MYVLHDMNSGNMNMRRNRKDDNDVTFKTTPTDENEFGNT